MSDMPVNLQISLFLDSVGPAVSAGFFLGIYTALLHPEYAAAIWKDYDQSQSELGVKQDRELPDYIAKNFPMAVSQ